MSTRDGFVVEVRGELREPPSMLADRLAELLKLSPQKAAALVARMPGVITKPLPEERALRVVLRLQAAGLTAVHRRVRAPADDASAAAVPAHAVRHPTGYDQIPSLDATRIDEPVEVDQPDPKLTPMSEAGFGAADIVLPVDPSRRSGTSHPSIVESGSISRPMARPPLRETPRPDADDADPTMVMPPAAEPGEAPGTVSGPAARGAARGTPVPVARPNGARSGASAAGTARAARSGDHPAVAPSSRLREAIARDRDSGERPTRDRRRTLTEEELHLTPSPEVTYRSTKSAAERALTLTPPSEEALRRGGVREDELASSRERRRGRFGRRLSTLVTLPVTLSWVLSAGFIYVLLPSGLRAELWVPLAAATAIAALTGALAAGLATVRTARDVVRLRDDAERISMGDLSAPVQVRRSDELGDVATSIDRLRVSLQEALARLRKRR